MESTFDLKLLLGAVIAIVLFLVFREAVNWYNKVNERVGLMKDTNELLKQIVKNTASDNVNTASKNEEAKGSVMTEEQKKTYEKMVNESKS
jgi:hypothetical protein